jgi:hypothetical protein
MECMLYQSVVRNGYTDTRAIMSRAGAMST